MLSPSAEGEGRKAGHCELIELGSMSEKPGTKDRAAFYSDSLLD